MFNVEIPLTQEFQQTVSIWCRKEEPIEKKGIYSSTVQTKWLIAPVVLQIGNKEEMKLCPFCHHPIHFKIEKTISITNPGFTLMTASNLIGQQAFTSINSHLIDNWPSSKEGRLSIDRMKIFFCLDCGYVTSSSKFTQCPKCNSVNYTDINSDLITKCKRCSKQYVSKSYRCPNCGYTKWDSFKDSLKELWKKLGKKEFWWG